MPKRQELYSPTQLPESGFTIGATVIDEIQVDKKPDPTIAISDPSADDNTVIDAAFNHEDNQLRVVGWLVCVKGNQVGRDFHLRNGWNRIGRDASTNDIVIADEKVDKQPAVRVAYVDMNKTFAVAPCESAKNMAYVNGLPLLGPMPFQAYDRLSVGDTELILIPLCSEKFSWNE